MAQHESRPAAASEPRDSSRGSSTPTTSATPGMNAGVQKSRIGGTYLLTWVTYGSWLPGDTRGFVSANQDETGQRVIHNTPGEAFDADMPELAAAARRRQKGRTVLLDRASADVCVLAFQEVADRYNVGIHVGAVMRSHIHLVVSADDCDGARLLHLFKGVSSRRLGQAFGKRPGGSWWADHGSRRLLPVDAAVREAERYVQNQPTSLKYFEHAPAPRHS